MTNKSCCYTVSSSPRGSKLFRPPFRESISPTYSTHLGILNFFDLHNVPPTEWQTQKPKP